MKDIDDDENEIHINVVSSVSDAPTLSESPFRESPADIDFPSIPVEIKSLIHTLPFFSECSESTRFVDEISKVLSMRKYCTGDRVIRQGDSARAMFFGRVKVISEDGEVEIAELSTGSYFGEIGIMYDVKRTANVVAKTNCTLIVLTAEKVNLILESFPEIKQSMKENAQERMISLADEYNKTGKSVNLDIQRYVDEFKLDTKRTHTIDTIKDLKVVVLEEPEENDEEEDLYVPPIASREKSQEYLSVAGSLSKRLTEKRRASVAVWSDAKLMQFAQNVVTQASIKESRFAGSNMLLNDDTNSILASTLSLAQLDQCQEIGLFKVKPELITQIIQQLDLQTILKLRLVSKSFSTIAHASLNRVNLSPWSKTLTDKHLLRLMSFAGQYVQNLSLKNCWGLRDGGLADMARYTTKLTTLNLSGVWELTDMGLLKVAEVSQFLQSMDLSNCKKITDTGMIGFLQQAKSLKRLNVGFCKNLSAKMMDHIAWVNLTEINLPRCTGINDTGFNHWLNPLPTAMCELALGTLTFSLEDINLSDCSFLSDSTIQVLGKQCPQLKRLCLSFCCSLTEKFATYISEGCPFIQTLDVSYCGGAMTDNATLVLAQGLPKLKELGMRGCVQLTDLGMEHLATHALALETVNFTQCKNVSATICKKLGIRWRTVSHQVYESGFQVVEENSHNRIRATSNLY
ncbi:hypothetical protein HDV02_001716 [Globomyces sp. JEL0801]|nr:hypothetical protein HDV02_001716 [Globomyces sp. JEL0801]